MFKVQSEDRVQGLREGITSWIGSRCESMWCLYPFKDHYRRVDQSREPEMKFSEMKYAVNGNF